MGIGFDEALDYFKSDDLIGIGMAADAVRRRLHPESAVSYVIEGRVSLDGPFEILCEKIGETVDRGGTGLVLQGEGGTAMEIGAAEGLLRKIRERFPALWLHGLCASEILAMAEGAGLPVRDVIVRLQDAGLNSLAGDDAEILDDAVQHSRARLRCSAEDWVKVHREAHGLGMRTTATMMFGGGETIEHRVRHLEVVRRLQEETGGFAAFTPFAFQPKGSAATIEGWEEATGVEYLKTLAISRIYLENIENVQSNLETQGLKVLQMGLRFGGNDVGSVPESGPKSAGARPIAEEDLRRVIRDAGFRPVQRDTLFRMVYLN
jgi:cyclic dehypoxanthinyl futalosine synthase